MGIKISELESTTTANANDVFIINQNGATKKITKESLASQIVNPDLEERVEELEEKVTDLEETVNSELEDGTATGTEITVNDSAVADASLDIGGNTEQTQYEGNNFFKPINSSSKNGINFTNNNDGSYTLTGTATSTTSFYITNIGYSGGSYTLNANNKVSNSGVRIQLETSQDNKILQLSNVDKYEVYNVVDINALSIIITSGTSLSNFVIYPQLLKGSYTSQTMPDFEPYVGGQASPSPDYPQNIHILKGSNTIKIYNANMFDGVMEQGQINTGTGLNTNSSTVIRTKNFLKIPEEVTTLKIIRTVATGIWATREYDENKNYLGFQIKCSANVYSNQFTLLEGTRYIRFVDLSNDLSGKFCLTSDLTLEEYVEHKEVIKTLTLPNGLEMCKIGDYKDEFVKDLSTGKWYKDEKINKHIFDGTETFADQGNGAYAINISDKYSRYGTDGLLCSHYSLRTGTTTSNYFGIDNDTTRVRFWNVGKTLSDFKTWLSTHNVELYYQLATPQLIEITDETLISELDELLKLRTYFGQTNITVEAEDLAPIMTLNYKKSNRVLRSEIDTIKARLDLLEN